MFYTVQWIPVSKEGFNEGIPVGNINITVVILVAYSKYPVVATAGENIRRLSAHGEAMIRAFVTQYLLSD